MTDQIEAGLVNHIYQNHKSFLADYLKIMLTRFYDGIWDERKEDAKNVQENDRVINGESVSVMKYAYQLFKERVANIDKLSIDAMSTILKSLLKNIESTNSEFDIFHEIQRLLMSHLCSEDKCKEIIRVTDDHIDKFLRSLLVLSAIDIRHVPELFDQNITSYIEKKRGLYFLFTDAIESTINRFIVSYRHELVKSLKGDLRIVEKNSGDEEDEQHLPAKTIDPFSRDQWSSASNSMPSAKSLMPELGDPSFGQNFSNSVEEDEYGETPESQMRKKELLEDFDVTDVHDNTEVPEDFKSEGDLSQREIDSIRKEQIQKANSEMRENNELGNKVESKPQNLTFSPKKEVAAFSDDEPPVRSILKKTIQNT